HNAPPEWRIRRAAARRVRCRQAPVARPHPGGLMLSARNQFKGTVKSIKLGNVMAEVIVTHGDIEIVSVITRASAEHLGLKVGDEVVAVIKSTEVLIEKD